MVERSLWEREVVSSSLASPTIRSISRRVMIKFVLYLIRWQLSTVIMTPVIATMKGSSSIWGTREDWIAVIVANLVGGSIFFWVDRFIFKSKAIEKWEIIRKGTCHDCGKNDLVSRLISAPGGYDRTMIPIRSIGVRIALKKNCWI